MEKRESRRDLLSKAIGTAGAIILLSLSSNASPQENRLVDICHAITYKSKDDPGLYISEGFEVDQFVMGTSVKEAEIELVFAIEDLLESELKEPGKYHITGSNSEEFELFRKTVDFNKMPDRVFFIPIHYTILYIYDRT